MSKVVLSFSLNVKCTMPVENIPAKSYADVKSGKFAKEFTSEIVDWIKEELADPEVDSEFVVSAVKVDIID